MTDSRLEKAPASDIAIVGMACLFPGAADLKSYWSNIVSKVDATSDPPPEAWDANVFYDPDSSSNDRVYCKRGGFIAPLAYFDPLENGVMPRAVEGGEPDQWLTLQVARDALADAGYGDDIRERERTAVILGKGTYLNRGNLSVVQHGRMVDQTLEILQSLHPELGAEDIEEIRGELKRELPPFNSDTAPSLIPNIIAGRIANRLDLMGPNYTVDAACASSLVAVEHAVRGLRSGEFDLALAGGVHVATPVPTLMLFCQLGALSRREQIRPFDALADGTVLGGGVGIVVLKRREDAERNGDRIYAVVKSVGISSDGRGLGVMAPRLEGEILALSRAFDAAGIAPRSVGLIEAHGTGTPVGDVTEVQALTRVFGERNGERPWCALGSVKSMIGHAMPAAGVAGLIKTALALHHKILPPTIHVDQPNPKLGLDAAPFYINTETRPWIHGLTDGPRRAGVNAFGFGGINAHAILEEVSSSGARVSVESCPMPWDSEVFLLAADTRGELVEKAQGLARALERAGAVDPMNLAFSLNETDGSAAERLAIVASSIEELREKLEATSARLSDENCQRIRDAKGVYFSSESLAHGARLAFLFSGEGSQYPNMLSELCTRFPEVTKRFDLVDRIFQNHARNFVPSDLIFPRPMFSREEREEAEAHLWQMEGAFEAVLTADWAIYEFLRELEIRPDVLLGHSTGEYAAMRAAGMLNIETDEDVAAFAEELNAFYYARGASEGVGRSALVAVGAGAEGVSSLLAENGGSLRLAMDNCPHQTVVVGAEGDAAKLMEAAGRRGWICERLSFDRPYHTPEFETYSEGLRAFFSKWIVRPPQAVLYSCTSCSAFPGDVEGSRELAVRHWMRPVEFRKTIETMYEDGVRLFVEVGPRGNLCAFVGDILRGKPHLAMPADTANRSGTLQLNHLVGALAVNGVPMRLGRLYESRGARRISLAELGKETKSRQKMKLDVGWIPMGLSAEVASRIRSRTARAEAVPEGAHGNRQGSDPPPEADVYPGPVAGRGDAAPGEDVMSSYWRTMDQFLSVQKEVMEGFLAGRPVPSSPEPEREAASNSEPLESDQGLDVDIDPATTMAEPSESSRPAAPPDRKGLLLQIVADRTGYPVEMIDLDLDLEADLGIDSIKRVEILGSFQQQTEPLGESDLEALAGRRTLREVLELLEGSAPSAKEPPGSREDESRVRPGSIREVIEFLDVSSGGAPRPEPSNDASAPVLQKPFLRTVDAFVPERELEARCELDLEEDLFLHDHVLGRRVSSADRSLRGLPVVPFTMGMEMLAEAASALFPELKVVGLRNVRIFRWMTLDGDRLGLRVVSRGDKHEGGIVASVRIFEEGNGASPGPGSVPMMEGEVSLAAEYPEPPRALESSLAGERPSTWTAERLYEDIMFHGPRFRGVASMDTWGEDGAVATLRVLAPNELFASTSAPALTTDPVLLDQPGQVVGFWMAEHLERGYVVFPYQLDALELYAAPGQMAGELECRARIDLVGDELVDSNLDIVDADGRVVCRFRGWKDRRFDLPPPFLRFLHRPGDEALSDIHPVGAGATTRTECRLDPARFPKNFFTVHSSIWQRALAHLVLSRGERRLWRDLQTRPPERLAWLLGRVAAKDAVRSHLRDRYGIGLTPADIDVIAGADGRLVPDGAWVDEVPSALTVTLSQSNGTFAAVVREGRELEVRDVDGDCLVPETGEQAS